MTMPASPLNMLLIQFMNAEFQLENIYSTFSLTETGNTYDFDVYDWCPKFLFEIHLMLQEIELLKGPEYCDFKKINKTKWKLV